jgi:hypothetical protein
MKARVIVAVGLLVIVGAGALTAAELKARDIQLLRLWIDARYGSFEYSFDEGGVLISQPTVKALRTVEVEWSDGGFGWDREARQKRETGISNWANRRQQL